MDCPENKEEYIHRIGRTGRNEKNGKSLLFLTPTKGLKIISFFYLFIKLEMEFLKLLNPKLEDEESKDEEENEGDIVKEDQESIHIRELKISSKILRALELYDFNSRVNSLQSQFSELRLMSRKAARSYLKSIILQPEKGVFDVRDIHPKEFLNSYGIFKFLLFFSSFWLVFHKFSSFFNLLKLSTTHNSFVNEMEEDQDYNSGGHLEIMEEDEEFYQNFIRKTIKQVSIYISSHFVSRFLDFFFSIL